MWQQLRKTTTPLKTKSLFSGMPMRSRYEINQSERVIKNGPMSKFKPTYKSVRLRFGDQARQSMVRGIERLADTVTITLGPGGRNVSLEYEGGDPKITKDGVTVVKSIIEKVREEDIGARLMKRVAGQTNTYAGDGTTTSTIIASEIMKKGYHAIQMAGAHPIALKRGLDRALRHTLNFLQEMALPASTENDLFNICLVSSNYNEDIARIVAQTMITVGINGTVNIVESPTGRNGFNIVNAMMWERGLVSDAFVSQEFKVEQKTELEFPYVLVVSNKITKVQEITKILEMVKRTKRSLMVFSEDLQQEPMSMMVYNNSKDIIKCAAVNIPWMGNMQKEMLADIAAITGATIVDNEFKLKLDSNDPQQQVQLEHLGSAKKIVSDLNFTHVIGGSGTQEQINTRKQEIQYQLSQENSPNLKNIHRDRLNRLNQTIAEIEVGGRTETQRGEIRDLIIDSLNSAKSAMQFGLLPGGGVAFYQASKILRGLLNTAEFQELEESERLGVQVVAQALEMPIRKVIENKTGESAAPIIDKIDQTGEFYVGYDVKKGMIKLGVIEMCIEQMCDMIEAGVVDSFNVIRTILQDSISLAGLIVTTECLVVKEKSYEPLPLSHYQDKREFF